MSGRLSDVELNPATRITVCSKCLTAACWLGEFYCDEYRHAGIVDLTVQELRRLDREHPSNWARSVR